MKVISFNCVEVLPELLEFFESKGKEGKSQTIRPAFKKGKPPRFEKEEQAKVMWKQRTSSAEAWFCKECGHIGRSNPIKGGLVCYNCAPYGGKRLTPETAFPKILGVVQINEVFKIEMWKENNTFQVNFPSKEFELLGKSLELPYDTDMKEIAQRDGFNSAEDMFIWFGNTYSLTTAKPFWVYRYEFCKGNI